MHTLIKIAFFLGIVVGVWAKTDYITLPSGRLVAVVTPAGYIPSGKCIFHFHGLRIASWDKTKRGTIDHFHFDTLIPNDTALIAPIASNGKYDLPSAYGSGFQVTLKVVNERLGIGCKSIAVSVHSAGGRVATALVQNAPKSFDKLVLLDATYSSNVAPFTKWLSGDSNRKGFAASRKNDGVYANASRIKGKNFTNVLSVTSDHWKVVTEYLSKGLK